MKLIVGYFFIFVFCSSIYANSYDIVSNTKNLSLSSISKYKLALVYFKEKDYKRAYWLFKLLSNKTLNDPNINYYLGRSAYELAKYDEAIIAFDNILFQNADNIKIKFELAKVYLAISQFKEAKKYLLEIKSASKISPNFLKIINKYIEISENKMKKHFISGVLITGIEYDSNVNNRSSFDVYNQTYNVPELKNDTEDESALAYNLVGVVNYAHKIDNNIYDKHNFMLYIKKMFDSKYNDREISLISYNPLLNVRYSNKLEIDYSAFIDNMWVGNINTLTTYGLNPKIKYSYKNNIRLNGYLKYQVKKHKQDKDKPKDSTFKEIGFLVSYLYSEIFSSTFSVILSTEDKTNTNTQMIDNNSYLYSITGNYVYNENLFFSPLLSYKEVRYSDLHSLYNIYEKQKEYKIGVSSTYLYDAKTLIQFTINNINQNSNVQASTYDKYVATINLIRSF